MASRKIVKRRIGPSGLDVECEADVAVYVDLKDDKKTTYEQGRGRHYRKTIYNYRPDNNNDTKRKYEAEPLQIEIENDGDGGGGVSPIPYSRGVIKSYYAEAGRGRWYMKTRIHFLNTEENVSRKIRIQRVRSTENPSSYVDVERVKSFKVDGGRGFVFRGKRVHRKHEEAEIKAMEGPCKSESVEE